MNSHKLVFTAVAAAFWFSHTAGAATLLITAFGTITSATTNAPSYETDYRGPFVEGDQITASLTYDSAASFGSVPVSGNVTGYFPASGVLTTGTGWSDQAWSYFNVGADNLTFKGQYGDGRYSSGFPLFYYSAMLSFSEPFQFVPPNAIDASAFRSGTLTGGHAQSPYRDSSFTARIDRITTLVTPVPGSAWLLTTSLAGLVAFGRKRGDAKEKGPLRGPLKTA